MATLILSQNKVLPSDDCFFWIAQRCQRLGVTLPQSAGAQLRFDGRMWSADRALSRRDIQSITAGIRLVLQNGGPSAAVSDILERRRVPPVNTSTIELEDLLLEWVAAMLAFAEQQATPAMEAAPTTAAAAQRPRGRARPQLADKQRFDYLVPKEEAAPKPTEGDWQLPDTGASVTPATLRAALKSGAEGVAHMDL